MKPGKYAIRITMLVLFLGIVAYFGIYIYNSLNDAVELCTVYTATEEDRAEASGFLVRDEQVLDQATSSLMEVVLGEGEKVGVGGVVARIYSSEEAAARQKEIAELEVELAQLQSLSSSGISGDAVALDQEIEDLMLDIHQNAATGSFEDMDDDAASLKYKTLRREYLYASESSSLESDISEMANRLATLQGQNNGATQAVITQVSGTFSGYVDGYEQILTVDKLKGVTPDTLEGWERMAQDVEADQYIGKLILSQTWYYVATMDAEDASRLGSSVTLRFTSSFKSDITMTVESISQEESGEVAVVFSTNQYLTQTTQMRYQSADIVYDSQSGLLVPLSAVRIQNTVDADGNTSSQEGVYVVVGNRAEWKEVTVLQTGEDYCLVQPLDEGSSDALRSGDTVIARGKNIYSGKVIVE
jgi:hypothetical protein